MSEIDTVCSSVTPSKSSNQQGCLHHLLEGDLSLLRRDAVDLLENYPGSLLQLLEKLQLCQTIVLQAIESPTSSPEDRLVLSDQDNLFSKCTTEENNIGPVHCQQSDTIPVEILHQVCRSAFLTAEEVGRLLLFVSKSFILGIGKEHAWEIICSRKWRNTVDVPVDTTNLRGFEWLFRKRIKGLNGTPNLKIAPPTLSPEVLTLLISIYNANQKEVVSLTLKDEALKILLRNGELNVALRDFVPLGTFPLKGGGIIGFNLDSHSEFCRWKATMHLLRSDQLQCACVHETSQCSWGEYDYCEDPNVQADQTTEKPLNIDLFNISPGAQKTGDVEPPIVEVDMGYLEFSTAEGLGLTSAGKIIEEGIREYENYTKDKFQAIKIEPTLLCFTNGFQDSSDSVDLVLSELRLDVWKRYSSGSAVLFHSGRESKKHGISLLHILDHLADWEEESL